MRAKREAAAAKEAGVEPDSDKENADILGEQEDADVIF